ncbi:MAG: hypothetical protein U0350_22685 [Caldilineaceae bacterium]
MNKNPNFYRKTFEQLEIVASKFWPRELSEQEAELSIIPRLLETQDQFISILNIQTDDLENLFNIIGEASIRANLFLKHLVILSDFGGEPLQRVSREFNTLFPNRKLTYRWKDEGRTYIFRALPKKKLNNKSLKIDGKALLQKSELNDLQRDAIAILLFGSAYSDENNDAASALSKCVIGDYLGKPDELAAFIKQRYIWVSKITGGAQSNSLGQLAQQFVKQFIEGNLDIESVEIFTSGRLPGVSHTDLETGRNTSFDLVVTDHTKYVAIEVSFQVTTNSVIERKSSQARARYEQIQGAGHKIAYVLDGAGNFQRETALRVICAHSHCTVAFSRSELEILCQFLRKEFKN